MQWRLAAAKKNGGIRKQFLQWIVPIQIRKELGLKDGSECTIAAHLGPYSFEPRVYVLTSGGEFRLPKIIAEDLRSRATADPTAEIEFDIHIGGSTPQPVALEKARDQAIEEGAFDPRNDEDARDRAAALIVRRQGQQSSIEAEEGLTVRAASPPGLALLKLTARADRGRRPTRMTPTFSVAYDLCGRREHRSPLWSRISFIGSSRIQPGVSRRGTAGSRRKSQDHQ